MTAPEPVVRMPGLHSTVRMPGTDGELKVVGMTTVRMLTLRPVDGGPAVRVPSTDVELVRPLPGGA